MAGAHFVAHKLAKNFYQFRRPLQKRAQPMFKVVTNGLNKNIFYKAKSLTAVGAVSSSGFGCTPNAPAAQPRIVTPVLNKRCKQSMVML